jgi:hypothetical protein
MISGPGTDARTILKDELKCFFTSWRILRKRYFQNLMNNLNKITGVPCNLVAIRSPQDVNVSPRFADP